MTDSKSPNKFMSMVIRFGDILEKLQYAVGALFVLGFVCTITTDVLFRTFFHPIVWLEELSRLGYMWAIFIGSSIALRQGTHFKIDVLTNVIKGSAKKIVSIISYIVIIVFVGILLFYGFRFTMMGVTKYSFPSGIPLAFFRMCIPLNGLFMLYYMVEAVLKSMYGIDTHPEQIEE